MNQIIKIIKQLAQKTETDVFVVGGYIRDYLLKKQSDDLDITVSKAADIFAKKLAAILKGKYIVLDLKNKNYRVALINNPSLKYIDVSLMTGKTIQQDLLNRDFTINSLAVNINNFNNIKKNLIDVCNGYKDLKNKAINISSKDSLIADPIRMLRAFRFASELNFNISSKLISQIKKNAVKIKLSVCEMRKNEFFRILNNKNSIKYITLMDDCKLLENMFPFVAKMKKSAKKFYYHPKGLFQHALLTMESLEKIFVKLKTYFPETKEQLEQYLCENFSQNVNRKNLLKFIAIFHDCAKPKCAKKIGKVMRFLGHEQIGAKYIKTIMKNLKMSNKETDYAEAVVLHHMRPSNLLKAETVTEKAKLRLFRDIGNTVPDLLLLALADWHSYKPLKIYSKKHLKLQEKYVSAFMKSYFEILTKPPKEKIIDGNVLMKELNIKPGKIVGKLLNVINEQYDEGLIKTKKEAVALAKKEMKNYL